MIDVKLVYIGKWDPIAVGRNENGDAGGYKLHPISLIFGTVED